MIYFSLVVAYSVCQVMILGALLGEAGSTSLPSYLPWPALTIAPVGCEFSIPFPNPS